MSCFSDMTYLDLLLRYDMISLIDPKLPSSLSNAVSKGNNKVKKGNNPEDHSIFHFDYINFLLWLNLFNSIKCEDNSNTFSDNLLV
jgi:hypothetical protein